MTVGDQDYRPTVVIGRIQFGPSSRTYDIADEIAHMPLRTPGYTVEPPIKNMEDFFARAKFIQPPKQEFCWLIEVVFTTDEQRAPRYFTGEVEPGWHGCTTINAAHAQKYSSKFAAQIDILKLAPRLIGEWTPREHAFVG